MSSHDRPRSASRMVRWKTRSAASPVSAVSSSVSAAMTVSTASSRSEEHTSELQSLMRISYAVFCLKKKNKQLHIYQITDIDMYNSQVQSIHTLLETKTE